VSATNHLYNVFLFPLEFIDTGKKKDFSASYFNNYFGNSPRNNHRLFLRISFFEELRRFKLLVVVLFFLV